jgi:hypothetical protein
VEDRTKGLTAEERLALHKGLSAPLLEKLHKYLLDLREQVLPKSPSGAAVRSALTFGVDRTVNLREAEG